RDQQEDVVGDPPELGLRLDRRHRRVPQRPAARREEQRHSDEQERRGHAGEQGEQALAHRLLYLREGPLLGTMAETAAAAAARCRSNTVTQLRAARASTTRSGIAVHSTSLGRRRRGAARRQRITKTKERACAARNRVSTTASTTCVMVDTAPSAR